MDITYPLLSIIFVGLGIVLIWLIPVRQAKVIQGEEGLKRFEAENEARRTLAQVLGGLLVLMSLYFTAKTLTVSQEGQLTDRFVKSLDLLGRDNSVESRLGGVYSLERIAKDSERDHIPIMSILAASAQAASTPPEVEEAHPYLRSILIVMTRRNLAHEDDKTHYFDLRRVAAPNIFLRYANFVRLNFYHGSLQGADLRYARFGLFYGEGLNLHSADLRQARFGGMTNFKNADFTQANLTGLTAERAYFEGAHFTGTVFSNATLTKCNFKNADLSAAVLDNVRLEESYFDGTNLRGQDLRKVGLRGANLVRAILDGARITRAQLSQVQLDEAGKAQLEITEQ